MSLIVKQAASRATDLLPKYGGFVQGAVNQAFLLLGYLPTEDERAQVESLVVASQSAPTDISKGGPA